MNNTLFALGLAVGAVGLASGLSHARDLSFEDRVQAQEAIERVHYSHQIGTAIPFEEAVPREVLEKKVRTYLEQSVALHELWQTPVTADALSRELERMAWNTRMPERLRELYAALGHDAFLIQECLVRPVLVDRLSRSFFASDERIHFETRRLVESLRAELVRGGVDPFSEHPERTVVELVPQGLEVDMEGGAEPARMELSPSEFERWRDQLPWSVGEIGPVLEEREAFLVRVLLEREPQKLRVASFVVTKRSWDDWWMEIQADLDQVPVEAVAFGNTVLPPTREQPIAVPCVPDDAWDNASFDDLPDARSSHTAIWTGSLMIVWGGNGNTGGRYDPATDSWAPTSTIGAPSSGGKATSIWTGSLMVVWTGSAAGGRYDPTTDSWTPVATIGAPSDRIGHTAVWTGSEMVVWGGYFDDEFPVWLNTGGRYDPVLDSWTPTSTAGAPAGRSGHTAVWTGDLMVIWGGDPPTTNTGGRYDPVLDSWTPTSTVGAPSARTGHVAVWTGDLMVVWGGYSPSVTGGRYDPATDSWTPTSMIGVPPVSVEHPAIWTGSEMVVWGGGGNTGGRYLPATDTWTSTSTIGAPSARYGHTAIWADGLMIVWGGKFNSSSYNTGGRYHLATDSWTPTSTVGAPSARQLHTAVWTGSRMVVWGGANGSLVFNTGGRYDPATDSWTSTSTIGAPSTRSGHLAVWTGNVMVVWGGQGSFHPSYVNTGGRYDPVTDSWTPISTVNAPSARIQGTAVWTGNRMVVWGGGGSSSSNTGGRYDLATDSWTPTSTTGAPSARSLHTAVWTGSRMLIWGGYSGSEVHSGARYDPETDSWTSMSTLNAPAARYQHTAVWTGSRMVTWAGRTGSSWFDSGGRYDPETDSWTSTSITGAPSARARHTAVWTGSRMIVWGGGTNSGGRYDPADDSWTPTSVTGAPPARTNHTAVWTGSFMLVWGGSQSSSGGRYALGQSSDDDGDGLNECQGDCNDTDPTVFAVPHEIQHLRWSSPTLLAWDPDSSNSGSGTVYDVMYGDLAGVSYFGTGTEDTCLANNVPDLQFADGSPEPAASEGWFFLVRGNNVCGQSRYETATDGSDRQTTACP